MRAKREIEVELMRLAGQYPEERKQGAIEALAWVLGHRSVAPGGTAWPRPQPDLVLDRAAFLGAAAAAEIKSEDDAA